MFFLFISDKFKLNLVEIKLIVDVHAFTQANKVSYDHIFIDLMCYKLVKIFCCGFLKENLSNQISLLLHKQTSNGETRVDIKQIDADPRHKDRFNNFLIHCPVPLTHLLRTQSFQIQTVSSLLSEHVFVFSF